MVRVHTLLMVILVSAKVQSQVNLILERELIHIVDENLLSLAEAEIVSAHILKYGWPKTANEAWAVAGLSNDRAKWLATSGFWSACVKRSQKFNEKNFRASADFKREYEGNYSSDFMLINRGVGLRVKNGLAGGYIKNSLGPVSFIIGDHRRHWGAGLVIDRFDPFNSMRYSHELSSPSRAFDGALPTASSSSTRGGALKLDLNSSWIAFSGGLYDEIRDSYAAAFFKTHQTVRGSCVWGVMAEKRDSVYSGGASLRSESGSFNLESEVAYVDEEVNWLIRGVLTSLLGDYLYWTVDSEMKRLAGIQFGDRVNGIRVEATMNGELRVVGTKKWEWGDESEVELRSRLRLVDARPYFDCRLGLNYELIRVKAQVQTSISSQTLQSALSLIVGDRRKICVAIMNGAVNSTERLYQLLPTSTGYRMFSIGNDSKALAYYEILDNRVRLSVERVWYRREAEEMIPYNYSNRVSVRFEWR